MTETAAEPRKSNPYVRSAIDYAGPLAFLVGYFITKDFLMATWWLVGVSAVALAAGFVFEKRLALLPAFTGGAALVFGLLTLVFHDKTILMMKPTFIDTAIGAGLLIGRARGANPLKLIMGDAIKLSPEGWGKLTLRYGVFFLCLAALNELVWRTQPEATWVLFKMPGLPILTLIFSFTQVPGMLKDAKAMDAALKAAETQD